MYARFALVIAMLILVGGAGSAVPLLRPPRILEQTCEIASTPAAINNFGHVAGGYYVTETEALHAFVWTGHTGFTDLGTLGGRWSSPRDINDRGEVIGLAQTSDGAVHGFLWTPSAGMRDLGPYQVFNPRAINNLGVIAGSLNNQAALRMSDGRFVPLGNVGGSPSVALDINDRGEVVGSTRNFGFSRPFFWSRETGAIDLHEPGDRGGAASRINNRGEVAGFLLPVPSLQSYVYTWTREGGRVVLGGYPGGHITGSPYGDVLGINSLGQVVATSTYPGDEVTRQLLWNEGAGPFVVAENGNPYMSSMGINEAGEVAGVIIPPGRRYCAAVWTVNLTREQRADSLRALVQTLELRGALRRQDAWSLTRHADNPRSFTNHVAALVRSGRLAPMDGWMLTRPIWLHSMVQ